MKEGLYPVISSVKKSKQVRTAFHGSKMPIPHNKKIIFTTFPLSSGGGAAFLFETRGETSEFNSGVYGSILMCLLTVFGV